MVAAAHEEVQVVLVDHEVRRGERSGGAVEGRVVEAVGEPVAEVAGDTALTGRVAGGRAGSEGVAGSRPAAEGSVVEAAEIGAGGRRVRLVVGGEGLAVEAAREVLRSRTSGDPAGIQAHRKYPLLLTRLSWV